MNKLILVSAMLTVITACDKPQEAQTTSKSPAAPAPVAPKPEVPLTGPMSFFITSAGRGDGANFGGIEGADEHCQDLASDVGADNKTWRAYLSKTGTIDRDNPENDIAAINARDRIGKGPWFNAKGELIARDIEHLHGDNNLNKQTGLNEKGEMVNGRGEKPNRHDILTGTRADGTAFSPHISLTCKNWTHSGEGSAGVGHHDKTGPVDETWAKSWNFSHFSRGCGQEALQSSGGDGLIYCFAID